MRLLLKVPKRLFRERELYSSPNSLVVMSRPSQPTRSEQVCSKYTRGCWIIRSAAAIRANFFQVFAPVLRSSATKTNFAAVAGRFFLFGQRGHTLVQLAPAQSWGFLLPTTTRPTLSSCECLAEVSKRTGEQFYSRRRSVQSVMAKRNRPVTLVTRVRRESNYAAFSPGAEGNLHAQGYLAGRRCRRVGRDWYRNMDWRQNIHSDWRARWFG